MITLYETDRIRLTTVDIKQLNPNYEQWFYDPEVTKYNSHGLYYNYNQTKQQELELMLKEAGDPPKRIIWMIWTQAQKRKPPKGAKSMSTIPVHIGNISLQNIDWINRSAEFAIIIGEKDYWDKGYGTEAGKLLIEHGFDRLNINRIWLGCCIKNTGMVKLAEKLLMSQCGRLNQAQYFNNEYYVIKLFETLKGWW
jgi:RimJ/RimL family protein N-acetyltransferase